MELCDVVRKALREIVEEWSAGMVKWRSQKQEVRETVSRTKESENSRLKAEWRQLKTKFYEIH